MKIEPINKYLSSEISEHIHSQVGIDEKKDEHYVHHPKGGWDNREN
jgi:hypothetical protein